jgi:hypothetical protein
VFGDAPVFGTTVAVTVYTTTGESGDMLLFFNARGGMWTVAFNVSVRAQGYYGSIKLVSEDWNIFGNNGWISGRDQVKTRQYKIPKSAPPSGSNAISGRSGIVPSTRLSSPSSTNIEAKDKY